MPVTRGRKHRATQAAGEDEAPAAGAELLDPGAERPPEADRGGEQLAGKDLQRLALSEPCCFTFEEARGFDISCFGISWDVSSDGKVSFIDAVVGAALERGVPPMSVILALNGSDVSGLARDELAAMLKVRPLALTVRPPADLRGEQLEGRDLQGMKLPGARLAGANLKGSDLRGAELQKAVLQEGLVLAPPDVEGLEGAALGEAWKAWWEKGMYDKSEYFKPAEEGAEEPDAADLSDAKLAGTNLTAADLRGVELDEVEGFEGIELPAVEGKEGKELGEVWKVWGLALRSKPGKSVRVVVLIQANLAGASMSYALLRGAELRGAQLQGAGLCGAQLQAADLWKAQLQGAWLLDAELQGACLIAAELQGAVLTGADLRGADLTDANLAGADLRNADLRGADLSEADLTGADLEGADLRGADLSKADLTGANLEGADLRGTKFAFVVLGGARLKFAIFSPFKPPKARSETPGGAWRLRAVGKHAAKGLYAALAGDSDGGSDNDSDDEEEEEVDGQAADIVGKALDEGVTALVKAAAPALKLVEEILGKLRAALSGCIAVLKTAGECVKPEEFLCDAARKLVHFLVSELLQPLLAVCSGPHDSWASLRMSVLQQLEAQPKELLRKFAVVLPASQFAEEEAKEKDEATPAAGSTAGGAGPAAEEEGGEAAGDLLRELLRLIAEEATSKLPALKKSVEAVVSDTLQTLSLRAEVPDVELGLLPRDFTAVADRLEKHLETVLIKEGIGKLVSKFLLGRCGKHSSSVRPI